MSLPNERILFGVPGYHGEDFVTECLESIRTQTHQDWVAWISLDGDQPAMLRAVRPFLADPRFRVTTQPTRLGWVDNINWLMDRMQETGAAFWCYQQQDDLIAPTYAEALVHAARSVPEASVVYSDLVAFGELEATIAQPSVTGSRFARLMTVLLDHHAAVAMRGLTRGHVLTDGARLRHNEVEDFSADSVWLATLALAGDLVRVPEPLYRKRYHAANEHGRWKRWPDDVRRRGWLVHCADAFVVALEGAASVAERRMLFDAALHRLTASRMVHLHLPEDHRTDDALAALRLEFIRHLRRERGVPLAHALDRDWATLRRRTR